MKKIILPFFVLLGLNLSAQIQPKSELKSVKVEQTQPKPNDPMAAPREYLIHPDKLKLAFISGQIPADFPKYNNDLDKKANIEIAKTWARANRHLILEKYWNKIDQ
ncbi:MAG: hypothetical protein RL264_2156 [Bacteroidota bacterium]|jgi:hypothetical protein